MLKDEIEELKGSVEIMEKEVKEQTLALEIFQEMKVENKRKNVIIKILIALNLCFLIALVGSNVGWLIYESSFETVTETQTVEQHQEDTDKYGRETIVYIANKTNLSTATVSRRIKKIKSKIKRLI